MSDRETEEVIRSLPQRGLDHPQLYSLFCGVPAATITSRVFSCVLCDHPHPFRRGVYIRVQTFSKKCSNHTCRWACQRTRRHQSTNWCDLVWLLCFPLKTRRNDIPEKKRLRYDMHAEPQHPLLRQDAKNVYLQIAYRI